MPACPDWTSSRSPRLLAVSICLFSDSAASPKRMGRWGDADAASILAGVDALHTMGGTNFQARAACRRGAAVGWGNWATLSPDASTAHAVSPTFAPQAGLDEATATMRRYSACVDGDPATTENRIIILTGAPFRLQLRAAAGSCLIDHCCCLPPLSHGRPPSCLFPMPQTRSPTRARSARRGCCRASRRLRPTASTRRSWVSSSAAQQRLGEAGACMQRWSVLGCACTSDLPRCPLTVHLLTCVPQVWGSTSTPNWLRTF